MDNLFNYRQVDKESFLWINGDGEMDVIYLWGPNRGRYIYAEVKLDSTCGWSAWPKASATPA